MDKYFCSKMFTFDAAHRLFNNKGKCNNLHGHTYKVEVCLSSTDLNHNDMVIDFNEISLTIGNWVHTKWDHSTLVCINDTELLTYLKGNNNKHFVFVEDPTAETMCRYLHEIYNDFYKKNNITLEYVKIWETPDSFATYTFV